MSQDDNISRVEIKPSKTVGQKDEACHWRELKRNLKQILPTNKLNFMTRPSCVPPVGDYYCYYYYCPMVRDEPRRKSESNKTKLAQDSHQSQHYYVAQMSQLVPEPKTSQFERRAAFRSRHQRRHRRRRQDPSETSHCHRQANWCLSLSRTSASWLILTFGLLFLVHMTYFDLLVDAAPGKQVGFIRTIESPFEERLEHGQQTESGHRRHHQHQISKREEMDAESAPEVSASTRPNNNNDELDAADSTPEASRLNGVRPAPIKHQPQGGSTKLHIVRLFAPDSIQNGTQDVTIDCMFKYDKKLDQRLAIKWYFNDEVEPIYQWIPELNKRVYSDKYERFIDKQYQVNEDVDFMLQAYKLLTSPADQERDWDRTSVGEAETGAGLDNNSPLDNNSIVVGGRRRSLAVAANQQPRTTSAQDDEPQTDDLAATPTEDEQQQQVVANRKLLANRLNRLAKLGSDHSRQLLSSLRSVLAMDNDEVSKFRALRLVRPTVEMDGRYTCSISSLDGDDLQSTRLIVYEPPKSFTFNVTKSAGQMYNLTCQAGPTYPRPSLALYRYRAGQLEAGQQQHQQQQQQQQPGSATSGSVRQSVGNTQDLRSGRHAQRPRLAATTLKQEPLAGTQVQLKISAKRQPSDNGMDSVTTVGRKLTVAELNDDTMITMASSSAAGGLPRINLDLEEELATSSTADGDHHQPATSASPYEISAWALVDEASLSSNLVTQFECVLTIDGANYEQRQSLALQKGWHVNSSALTAKSTLVGLMSVLASLLCLTVALVSAILIFKLLRRHANKSTQVHQQVTTSKRNVVGKRRSESSSGRRGRSKGDCEVNSSSASTTPSDVSASTTASGGPSVTGAGADGDNQSINSTGLGLDKHGTNSMRSQFKSSNAFGQRNSNRLPTNGGVANRMQPQPSSRHVQPSIYQQQQQHHQLGYSTQAEQEQHHSDGIYRVPESRSSFGTRYMAIGNDHQEQQQQQQQIWSTSYGPLGSPNATSRHLQDEYETQANIQHQNYYHANGQPQANNSRGMLTTNQLAAISGGVQVGGSGQKLPHRPHQPATISVNGKQLYC